MACTKDYAHPFLNGEQWDCYQPRPDDIIIATPFKSGTTWMQMIIQGLLYGIDNPPLLKDVDLWIEFRITGLSELKSKLQRKGCRRFIKTHLPRDAFTLYDHVKYIIVDRDPRDVFMSLWNHYGKMDLEKVNRNLPEGIEPIPQCPEDIRTFWRLWLTKGYFPWESEGYPFWSNLRHAQSWYDVKNMDNVMHVHYSDLLADSAEKIREIANFIGIEIGDRGCQELAVYTSFENTKKNLDKLFPHSYKLFENGADTFFNKGTNGRWQGVLTDQDLELLATVSGSILSNECRDWLFQNEFSMPDR